MVFKGKKFLEKNPFMMDFKGKIFGVKLCLKIELKREKNILRKNPHKDGIQGKNPIEKNSPKDGIQG